MKTPVRRYKSFHGRNVRAIKELNVHYPEALIKLGRAVAIEYECDKFNGGGDGTRAVYRHEFNRGAHLYMDEEGKRQLYIIGNRIKINQRGIIH